MALTENDLKEIGKLIKNLEDSYSSLNRKLEDSYSSLNRKLEDSYSSLNRKLEDNYSSLSRKLESIDDRYSSIDRKMKIIETAGEYSGGRRSVPEIGPSPIACGMGGYEYDFVPSQKTSWDEPWER